MKRVANAIEQAWPGVTVYRMTRHVGVNRVLEYRIAVTDWEREHARFWVAFKLREARAELRRVAREAQATEDDAARWMVRRLEGDE